MQTGRSLAIGLALVQFGIISSWISLSTIWYTIKLLSAGLESWLTNYSPYLFRFPETEFSENNGKSGNDLAY